MQLPPALRQAIEARIGDSPMADLRLAGKTLSERYRAEVRDGRQHLASGSSVDAYLAQRMPATFAALRAAVAATAERAPAFAPNTLLDVGAGPGTALWAAADVFGAFDAAMLAENSAPAMEAGRALVAAVSPSEAPAASLAWRKLDLRRGLPDAEPADLVTMGYVLDELDPAEATPLVRRLWALTSGVLLIVEPGTPAGWRRILAARDALLAEGAHLLAPCPHAQACPVTEPDWCHFAERVERTRTHRQAKSASVPFEDEKFSYVAATREPAAEAPAPRILAPPRRASGRADLKLCLPEGGLDLRTITRREGEAFRLARRAEWGDALG